MYQFRIGHAKSPSMTFLPWASHMETFLLTMTSTPNTLGVTKDATMAVELSTTQFWVCQEANGQFCSITTPFQPLANPPSCVAALYARSPADITSQCSLQIRKTSDVNLPTQIFPDVWILTTPLSTPTSTIMLICPEKATETITLRKLVHIV